MSHTPPSPSPQQQQQSSSSSNNHRQQLQHARNLSSRLYTHGRPFAENVTSTEGAYLPFRVGTTYQRRPASTKQPAGTSSKRAPSVSPLARPEAVVATSLGLPSALEGGYERALSPRPPASPHPQSVSNTRRGMVASGGRNRRAGARQGDLAAPSSGVEQHGPLVRGSTTVGVTPSLRPIIGEDIDVYHRGVPVSPRANADTQDVGASGDRRAVFTYGADEVAPSAADTSLELAEQEELERQELERYLTSPFSFIDKVIDNPYTDEFVYLNAVGPYDLRIVRHNEIDPNDYYTMSRTGVTHFYEQEMTFTTLEQWEREYFLFTKMMEIPFFKKFRIWKTFVFWKKFIHRMKHKKCCTVLREHLNVLNPHLCRSMLQLRSLCYDVSQWHLYNVRRGDPFKLEQFTAVQERHIGQVVKNLDAIFADVRDIVLNACDLDLREFLIANGFRRRRVEASTDMFEEDEDDFARKISHAERAAHRTKRRKLTKYIRLCDYLIIDTLVSLVLDRTADFKDALEFQPQTAEAIPSLLPQLTSAHDDAGDGSSSSSDDEDDDDHHGRHDRRISSGDPYSSGVFDDDAIAADSPAAALEEEAISPALFQVEMAYEPGVRGQPGRLVTKPSLADFEAQLDEAVLYAAKRVMAPSRLLTHETFSVYTQGNIDEDDEDGNDEQSLHEVVTSDERFADHLRGVVQGIQAAFVAVDAYVHGFEPYRALFEENRNTDIASFRDSTVKQFGRLMRKYEHQVADFSAMPVVADIGVVRVDSRKLKHFFLPEMPVEPAPGAEAAAAAEQGDEQDDEAMTVSGTVEQGSPQQCLTEMQDLLPTVAFEECCRLRDELNDAHDRISAVPTLPHEFVDIVSFMQELQANMESLNDRFTFVHKLYSLTAKHGIRISPEKEDAFEQLQLAHQKFKMAIEICEASIEPNTRRFGDQLANDIPVLEAKVVAVAKKLNNELIANADAVVSDRAAGVDDRDGTSTVAQVIALLEDISGELGQLEDTAKEYQRYQRTLDLAVTEYDTVDTARADVDLKLLLWRSLRDWQDLTQEWRALPLRQVDTKLINETANEYTRAAAKARQRLGDDHAVVTYLRQRVLEFQYTMPVVKDLLESPFEERHWQELRELFGEPNLRINRTPLDGADDATADSDDGEADEAKADEAGDDAGNDAQPDTEFTLGDLIDMDAMKHKNAVADIATKAYKESGLAAMLAEMTAKWDHLNFPVKVHRGLKDVYVLGNLDDVFGALDESLVTMNTIMGSRYVEPIRDEVQLWNGKLLLFQETLDEWITCQRAWMYLEIIFSAQDIVRQLPEESKTFEKVDRAWKEIMKRTYDYSRAIEAGTIKGLRENFQSYNATLDKVQKRLEQYLETKRVAFPRFYFLSNDELLEILANSKDIEAVQRNLRKCFDNIARLEMRDKDIIAMLSSEGERVPLGRNNRYTQARSSVEVWLNALETDMINSLRRFMKKGLGTYTRAAQRSSWVLSEFGQIVMTVSQIAWCKGCEDALSADNPKRELQRWYDVQLAQLDQLVQLVGGELSKVNRKKIVTLITTDVHARDVTARLRDSEVAGPHAFAWQQQLRFYWDVEDLDDCVVRQSNAHFRYGYEYMGVTSRLVITPLTDRCWMTITGALHIRFGASPAGPAGTGKTESTKDLAKAMGWLCIVLNCSDQLDYKMMGKLFSGLAQCGAWTCLDEFNRIDIEVLSVVAQQLLVVRQALLAEAEHFDFEGQTISLKDGFGVMITMNPGYAGRTELPDNLKVLFRPVAMMIPDYALIAEIMLFAEGFSTALPLSRKMVKLYKLSSEQLSQQDHYDFGMRAVKSVLVMAGALKRAEPELDEDVVLIRAMRDSNLPKFLADDIPLFQAIVRDLFPSVVIPEVDQGELTNAITSSIDELGLQPVPSFVTKVTQLFDTFNVRFGVMLVGPTGGGKTECYRVLANAMTRLREANSKNEAFQRVHTHVLNPKSISMGELYGQTDPVTQEWSDGLGSTIMRAAIRDASRDRHWCVFDGPVDALWIENMNTVLDDNMTLCLASGERIKLKPELRMLFEVQDLAVASPATVSRCGMVYVPPDDLGFMPFVRSWLPTLPEATDAKTKRYIEHLFDKLLPQGLEFLRTKAEEPIPTVDVNIATSLCRLFASLFVQLEQENPRRFTAKSDGEVVNKRSSGGPAMLDPSMQVAPDLREAIDMIFSFCFVWSVGGGIDERFHPEFSKLCALTLPACPPGSSVFGQSLDVGKCVWVSWNDLLPEFAFNPEVPFFQLLVPTIDTVRYSWILKTSLRMDRSVFLTGATGVGKSVLVSDLFNRASQSDGSGAPLDITAVPLMFSAQTSALKTQLTIESKLVKLSKNLLGAPAGKKLVVFVDDVNMPSVEEYGAQPPVELLRQFQGFKGFYDRQKLFWKNVQDTTLICASAPPGGGRSELTPRFVRYFHMLCMPQPDETVMKSIFGSILKGFLATGFESGVRSLNDAVVDATVKLYDDIKTELLPTPAKSHYTFNLRDISKVFQGLLMVNPDGVKDADSFVRLWIHECMRCFHDRLVDDDDRLWFMNRIVSLNKKYFKRAWSREEIFEDKERGSIIFADWLNPGLDREYQEASGQERVVKLLHEQLEEFNMNMPGSNLDLVFFSDAVDHISRITRILRQPRGNAMLVGVGGSGKQTLTRLACYIAGCECMQIELRRGFGYTDFQEFLKDLLRTSGVDGKQVAFLFTERHILLERFLEDVNNLLNSGEVPNLFAPDELNQIAEDMIPVVNALGLPESREVIYSTFVQRVRDNLHVVLCMSPVGSAFRKRCRMFPSLINCCTIDWFTPWPQDALLSVSQRYLAPNEIELATPELRQALAETCVEVHESLDPMSERFFNELRRKVYTTPKSYLDMIQLYRNLVAEKREEMLTTQRRLTIGLQKLKETNELVKELGQMLKELQPELEQKAVETAKLVKQVAADQEHAAQVSEVVEAEAAKVNARAKEVQKISDDAQADLDKALPALQRAIDALDSLKQSDISEVKSMAKPPPGVVLTMKAVCTILGEKADWETSKKLMSNTRFLMQLKDLKSDAITPKIERRLRKFLDDPNFTEEKMLRVSKAATSLCMWVHAMVVYAKVEKEVEPKKRRVQEMQQQLEDANTALAEKEAQLADVRAKVAELEQQCDEAVAEKQRLDNQSRTTKLQLERAGKLTSGLKDEGESWAEQAETLKADIELIVGNVFLAAACISYFGAFTGEYREELVARWKGFLVEREIPFSPDFTLVSVLGNAVEIREWNINGLPTDSVSIDNGILVARGERWPLMIDPQSQANRWIKSTYKNAKLRTTRFQDPDMLTVVETAVRTGAPVLIEDVGEDIDSSIDPILLKAVSVQGTRKSIRLGDNDVEYDDNFQLFMTSNMPNPHYMPEVCIKVTLLNFTVTLRGLEDQLLGVVVREERPKEEKQMGRLIVSMANDRKQLNDLKVLILQKLSESEGNILDDDELIQTLADSKFTEGVIKQRVQEASATEAEISAIREEYRPVATRGSLLYFVISDLALIDPMYQYSLQYFLRLFVMCMKNAEQAPDNIAQRLHNLMTYLTRSLYRNVSRGLFETHKLIFSFLICVQILRERGEIEQRAWGLFLRGTARFDADKAPPNPSPEELFSVPGAWEMVCTLAQQMPDVFGSLPEHISNDLGAWTNFATHDTPHLAPLPGDWDSQLSAFRRLLVLRALRYEKIMFGVREFVATSMDKEYVEPQRVRLEEVYGDTDVKTPVIFVLSTGADPTSMLMRFAKERDYLDRLNVISLGQGQGKIASKMIQQAKVTGEWVLLQNCHLAKSWMPELEAEVEQLAENESEISPNFRLWLTSMPCSYFPVPVLQSGVKLTNEPPKGLRANLLRSFNNVVDEEQFEQCAKPEPWKKLLFGLCFFHATIQERKKFGPLGWNKMYEFNDSDLETSMQVLRMFLDEQAQIPWDALRYVCGQINYGGRVTDDWDRRCLTSILSRFFTPEILDDSYRFSPSGVYYAPPSGDFDSYLRYLEGLPKDADPEIFGMHENANLTFQRQETDKIISTVLSVQPRDAGGAGEDGGKTQDDVVRELAAQLEQDLPRPLDRRDAGPDTFKVEDPETGVLSSLATVLSQEIDRFNKLLVAIRMSLEQLQKAISGLVVMSPDLDRMYVSLTNNEVPELWERHAYPSLKPLASWFADLRKRVEFLADWLVNGEPNSLWLSGFFFPQGALTGALQSYSRKHKVAIDSLSFAFEVLDVYEPGDVHAPPEDGVFVHGLWCDGMRWDEDERVVSDSVLGELYSPMPVIHFKPTVGHEPDPTHAVCPVFKTGQRRGVLSTTGQSTNFILAIDLPSHKDPHYWVLMGAALLCQLST